jgi:hypothetical protein
MSETGNSLSDRVSLVYFHIVRAKIVEIPYIFPDIKEYRIETG